MIMANVRITLRLNNWFGIMTIKYLLYKYEEAYRYIGHSLGININLRRELIKVCTKRYLAELKYIYSSQLLN